MIKNIRTKFTSVMTRAAAWGLTASVVLSVCACTKTETNFNGTRFDETKHISVLVDQLTDFDSQYNVNTSKTAKYIHDTVLNDLNIDVSFVEADKLNFENGVAPDITYYQNYNIITTYYRMNGVINLAPYLDQYSSSLKNLTGLLGDQNIYWCTDNKDEVWYLTPKEYVPNSRVTFIRADWLEKLNLKTPETKEELQKCLIAFRDNADKLLGAESSNMIPFFIDNEPNVSAKPVMDSFLDTDIEDMNFYLHGYCRAAQPGYKDGLKLLNDWYNKDLLPKDYQNIKPGTKESYEPIEKGYVGAFCAKADYLYENGDNSHIKSLYDNCGKDAKYVAINTFEDKNGKYNAWDEDYLYESITKVFIPNTCKEPLACLIYLDWISNEDNIKAIINANSDAYTDDPYTSERYILTYHGINVDLYDKENADLAIKTAEDVNIIQRGNKCVRYWPTAFQFANSEYDIESLYPDSTKQYTCAMVGVAENEFDKVQKEKFQTYLNEGTYVLLTIRNDEWNKVMVQGQHKPW